MKENNSSDLIVEIINAIYDYDKAVEEKKTPDAEKLKNFPPKLIYEALDLLYSFDRCLEHTFYLIEELRSRPKELLEKLRNDNVPEVKRELEARLTSIETLHSQRKTALEGIRERKFPQAKIVLDDLPKLLERMREDSSHPFHREARSQKAIRNFMVQLQSAPNKPIPTLVGELIKTIINTVPSNNMAGDLRAYNKACGEALILAFENHTTITPSQKQDINAFFDTSKKLDTNTITNGLKKVLVDIIQAIPRLEEFLSKSPQWRKFKAPREISNLATTLLPSPKSASKGPPKGSSFSK